jgi:hypothetical protein
MAVVPAARETALEDLSQLLLPSPEDLSRILQIGWLDRWWLELSTASFPEFTVRFILAIPALILRLTSIPNQHRQYSAHQDRQRRLLSRLETLRNMTQRALDRNTEHLASRASEVVQLTEGAELMRQQTMRNLEREAMEEGSSAS